MAERRTFLTSLAALLGGSFLGYTARPSTGSALNRDPAPAPSPTAPGAPSTSAFNPQQLGAALDGVRDDTEELNKALHDHDAVALPPGSIARTTGTVRVARLHGRFDGNGAQIRYEGPPGTYALELAERSHQRVRGLRVGLPASRDRHGVHFNRFRFGDAADLRVTNAEIGYDFVDAWVSDFRKLHAVYCDTAFRLGNNSNALRLYSPSAEGCRIGIVLTRGQNGVDIFAPHLEQCGTGILLGNVRRATVHGGYFEDNGWHVVADRQVINITEVHGFLFIGTYFKNGRRQPTRGLVRVAVDDGTACNLSFEQCLVRGPHEDELIRVVSGNPVLRWRDTTLLDEAILVPEAASRLSRER
jgi:hypothetical protein